MPVTMLITRDIAAVRSAKGKKKGRDVGTGCANRKAEKREMGWQGDVITRRAHTVRAKHVRVPFILYSGTPRHLSRFSALNDTSI